MYKEFFCALYFVINLAAFTLALINRVHMFQLNAYKYVFHAEWIKSNIKELALKALLPLLSFLLCFIPGNITKIAGILATVVFLLFNIPKKAKKPLVFTARIKRLVFTCYVVCAVFSVLSFLLIKTGYSIYLFALPLVIPSYIMLAANIINRPAENLVRQKYINEAKKKISMLPNLTVIGITGSYGKTGTKYILEKLLSEKYNVLMTPASYNTTMGVVKVIRENLTAAHEIFICEMGARSTGEIKEICDIVKPKYGIITSIGPCHLETFGSIENVIKTKFELCDALPDDGIIFLNADNQYIAEKSDISKKAVYYGLESDKADFGARILSLTENGTSFEVITKNKESFNLSAKLLGAHSVTNIVGCVAVAKTLGVENNDIILGARRIEGAPHRLSLIRGNGFVIIDDSFNSNPSGCKAALDVLSEFDGQKIIITPGMIELGEKQEKLNREFARQMTKVCDRIFLVGQRQTKPIFDEIAKTNFPAENITVFDRVEDAINTAKALPTNTRNIILIENDLPDNF